MLTYRLEPGKGGLCLYEQLYQAIRADILSGNLKYGEKLPSKRALSANLGISTITVENAYAQLEAEGYLRAVPKSGFYVNAADAVTEHATQLPLPPGQTSRAKSVASSAPAEMHDSALPEEGAQYTFDFVSNRNEAGTFPLSVWARLMREVLSTNPDELLKRAPGCGLLQLRSAIADHLLSFRGMRVDPGQIVVGAGTEYLYSLLVLLLGRDKVYGVENPGYRKISQIYQSQNVVCQPLPLDKDGISMDALTGSNVSILHLSPSHHFPTGQVTSIGRRLELLTWANGSKDRYIIEDEYDSEFRLRGKPIPSLRSIDPQGKVIYMNTFSRSLSDTIRISYMVLTPELARRYQRSLAFYSCTVPVFEQRALALFLGRGYFDRHISRMRNRYRKKRELLLSYLKSNPLPDTFEMQEADSGLHFLLLPKGNADLSEDRLRSACREAGVGISFLSDYSVGDRIPEIGLVVNYTRLPGDQLEPALTALLEVLRQSSPRFL